MLCLKSRKGVLGVLTDMTDMTLLSEEVDVWSTSLCTVLCIGDLSARMYFQIKIVLSYFYLGLFRALLSRTQNFQDDIMVFA